MGDCSDHLIYFNFLPKFEFITGIHVSKVIVGTVEGSYQGIIIHNWGL